MFLEFLGLLQIVLPKTPDDWHPVRMNILSDMLEKHLIPSFKDEVKNIIIFFNFLF